MCYMLQIFILICCLVTKLCANLHSVVYFTHSECFLQGPSLKKPPLHLGSVHAGLYQLNEVLLPHVTKHLTPVDSSAVLSASRCNKAHIWHLRFGHMPFSQMKYVVPNCDLHNCTESSICQVCPAARQTRLHFPSSSIKSVAPFQLLHLDLWGPYKFLLIMVVISLLQ